MDAKCSFLRVLPAVVFLSQQVSLSGSGQAKCGYDRCNPVKDGYINVHLVPHTHDDVGWLKTVDQYYYGSKNAIQNAGVQYILDSVIPQLQSDPTKRFIYVEIAFFWRWWNEQHDAYRHQIQQLVSNGRLEFILGGWSMNDEATTHYSAIIDQHTLGFDFLKKTFGACSHPRVAWQIDPFGHSKEMASLFAQMGFDGLFFGRLDYQDKLQRMLDKTMEMVWKGSDSLGTSSNLFTGALFNGYNPPSGFCFDAFCTDDPIMDDKRLFDYNVQEKMINFSLAVKQQAEAYTTNHLMMTMGSDFEYSNAHVWYKNLDKLIYYVNDLQQTKGHKVNLLYSTPSCYLYNLNKANATWTTKSDDFFPYADRAHSFWTGYFTSRPALKRYVRKASNIFQVCRQMDVLGAVDNHYNVGKMWKSLSVVQHHDAVAGTEKQAVADDYAKRLSDGITACETVINSAFNKFMPKQQGPVVNASFCPLLNISYCSTTESSKQFTIIVYNPLAHKVSYWVRVPVVGSSYSVMDPTLEPILAQIISISYGTKRIPERAGSIADNELVFRAELPALGFSTYSVTEKSSKYTTVSSIIPVDVGQDFVLKNKHVSLRFNGTTGQLLTMQNLDMDIQIPLSQDFLYYLGEVGNNSTPDLQASNNYIFRPQDNIPTKLSYPLKNMYIHGPLVQEVHQCFGPWVTQIIRLYTNTSHVEFEWTVGSIPIEDGNGKEVISRFSTDLNTKGVFYTDANGRQILQRRRNFRPTWKLNQTEPVAGNYFPINSKIFIRDEARNVQLTVLTDRSQGGSSILDGQLEIMVHRRLLYDDGRGVGEPLNETGCDGKGLIVRGKHYLYLDNIRNSTVFHRQKAVQLFMDPFVSFTNSTSPENWIRNYKTQWSGLRESLPPNVNLLTLQQWTGPTLLIRLEHIYEEGEAGALSDKAVVNLRNLFAPFNITSVEEQTLGANMKLADLKRLNWKISDQPARGSKKDCGSCKSAPLDVVLWPMEIRTFQVSII